MEAKAILRYARLAPRKGRRVIDLVRGKDVGEALTILKFLPQHASFVIEKVLRSALANARQKNIGDVDDLVVSQAFVGLHSSDSRQGPWEGRCKGRSV